MGVLFGHEPVMVNECVAALNLRDGGVYVDCTVGGGGHSSRLLKENGGIQLIGVDRDEDAVMAACNTLKGYTDRCTIARGNFTELPSILDNLGIGLIDGALMDLGVSSFQLDTPERGFSYLRDGPLDMRMDNRQKRTAKDIVNRKSRKELERIFFDYGEERYAKRIADRIDRVRLERDITTTGELVDIIKAAVPKELREADQHPAKRVFQALRIATNDELGAVEKAIPAIAERLASGGRLAVITFHSGEDRIVKTAFRKMEHPCECPRELPVCVCGKVPTAKVVTRKPIAPSKDEVSMNPRSRSAKLRIIEKL